MTVRQQCAQVQNGTSSDLFNVNNVLGVGVYNSPLKFFQVIPLAPVVNFVSTGIVTPTRNSYLALNSANTSTNVQGETVVVLDCLRNLVITSTSSQVSAQTFIVTGYDEEGVEVQAQITIGALSTNAFTLKGFKSILSVQITSTGSVGTFTVGTSNGIALPAHLCLSTQRIISCTYNGSPVTPVQNTPPAGATQIGFYSTNWRTTIPTALTYDARGIFSLYSAPNGTAALTVLYHAYGADSNVQTALRNNDYTAYTMIGYPSPGPYPTPYTGTPRAANTQPLLLVAGDETGIQYPGQMNEYNAYFNNPVT